MENNRPVLHTTMLEKINMQMLLNHLYNSTKGLLHKAPITQYVDNYCKSLSEDQLEELSKELMLERIIPDLKGKDFLFIIQSEICSKIFELRPEIGDDRAIRKIMKKELE